MSVAHLIQILLHGISLLRVAEALQTDFVFNGFIGKDLRLIRDASIDVSRVPSLTKDSELSTGRAFYPKPLKMKNKSFSTTFILSIAPARGYSPGHGFAFLLTPYANLRGALPAQYLGLLNTTADKSESDHLFAVEFDTCDNIELQDINDNHVGVDLNTLRCTNSTSAGYWIGSHNEGAHGSFQFRNLSLNSGQNIQAWLEYDGAQKHLNITISPAGYDRPLRPLLSLDMDLSDLFIDDMYAGFSASTGSLVESNFILAWSLSTSGRVAKSLDASNLPSFLPRNIERSRLKSRGFIVTMSGVSIALLALFILAVIRIHKNGLGDEEELIEDWELEFWPHRFMYKDLNVATKGFSEEQLLGCGGFGRVYKGCLPGNGLQVAVKCVSHESKQGIREFIAEISSMGRLQHRNLVQLRGWCKNQKELLLVYDYMPNRSLDKMIFDDPQPPLAWPERYRVLKGVASGLLYLHEEWEHMVLHRDVKASNVMLDAEFNGRLGDFGLARLYDHAGVHSHTTRVVGTLGYLAPELVHNGKATPSTDVFSFGTLLLEVACGRRPIEHNRPPEELVLGDWVWELSNRGCRPYIHC